MFSIPCSFFFLNVPNGPNITGSILLNRNTAKTDKKLFNEVKIRQLLMALQLRNCFGIYQSIHRELQKTQVYVNCDVKVYQ